MPVLKVWSMDRTEKKTGFLTELSIDQLLEKANAKGVSGSKVFLMDGTEIDENEALIEYKENPFLVGDEYNIYTSVGGADKRHSTDSASTITVSSLPASPSSCISSRSADFNSAFVIPYEKIPNSLLAKLNDCDSPLPNSDLNTLVRVLTHELIHDNPHPTRSLYRAIARELCERYPCLYDRDEDTKALIGSGFYTVFKKIEERVHYLQRPNKSPTISKRKINQIKNLSAGCKEWDPSIPEEETPESLREKQLWLARTSTIKERDEGKVEHFMEVTYPSARQFLNTNPTISAVIAEWPILMEPKYMIKHFERLCCINTSDCMSVCLEKNSKAIENLKKILKKPENTAAGDNTEELQKFLQLVGYYFKEETTFLFQNCQDVTKSDVGQLSKTPSPSIISTNIEDTDTIYYLVIEKQVVSEVSHFSDALKLICAAYYVFNLVYPQEVQCVLEFVQRYIFKINPTEGSKVKKTTKQLKGNILSTKCVIF